MALQGPFTWQGVVYPEAYARQASINITSELGCPIVLIYADKAAREQNPGEPLTNTQFITDSTVFDNGVVFQLGYDYLKTQPEFAGWIDV